MHALGFQEFVLKAFLFYLPGFNEYNSGDRNAVSACSFAMAKKIAGYC
jgi:hypothetical protein